MRHCVDRGHSHFLRAWPGRTAIAKMAGGSGLRVFLLAKGPARDVVVHWDGVPCAVAVCDPCALPEETFRWLSADLPPGGGEGHLMVRLKTEAADLALDLATGNPVIRVPDPGGPRPAVPAYFDPGLPARRILEILPPDLHRAPDWPEVWPLVRWVNRQWEYRNTANGRSYCPWRMEEILQYGGRGTGPDGTPAIAMCVHYAVVLAQSIHALGGVARLVPLAGSLNGIDGHFVTEMWSENHRKWILLDPQTAVCFPDAEGIPANAWELSQHPDPRSLARGGEHVPHLVPIPADYPYPQDGRRELFRNIGIWGRMDFHAVPGASPPGHGTTAYAETDILWLKSGPPAPMFPCTISLADYHRAPPRR